MSRDKTESPNSRQVQVFRLTPATLRALAEIAVAVRRGSGAAFIVSGPPGSGKTHLFRTIRDLSVTQGELPPLERDRETHASLSLSQKRFVEKAFQRLRIAPCYFSMGASARPLRDAVQEALVDQQSVLFSADTDFPGKLDRVDARLLSNNYDGLVIMVDEVGTSLAGKDPTDAAQDLCFLQEFAERLGGHRVVLLLATRRSLDVLDWMPYSELERIQDRYQALSLHIDGNLATRYARAFRHKELTFDERPTYRDRLAAAIEIYEQYVGQGPADTWATLGLGHAKDLLAKLDRLAQDAREAMSSARYADAEQMYEELVRRDPTSFRAKQGLEKARRIQSLDEGAYHYLQKNRYDRAREMLEQAVHLAPSDKHLEDGLRFVWERTLNELLDTVQRARSRGDLVTACQAYLELARLDTGDAPRGIVHSIRKEMSRLVRQLARDLAASDSKPEYDPRELRVFAEVAQEDYSIGEVLRAEYLEPISEAHARSMSSQTRSRPIEEEYRSARPRRRARPRAAAEASRPAGEPVRRLAELLVKHLDESDLIYYLDENDIKGKTLAGRTLDLCVAEDPPKILTELFGVGRLKRVAEDMELDLEQGLKPEQLPEAILRELGFSIPRKPVGIKTYREALLRLKSTLYLRNERHEIMGIGSDACDGVADRVLKDLLHFYCTALMGTEYEDVLREEDLLPSHGRRSLEQLTLGQRIGMFERMNGYLKKNDQLRDRMKKWFDRHWIIRAKRHIQNRLHHVSRLRNNLAHPGEAGSSALKRDAVRALDLLEELFKDFDDEGIYPPVVAVEAIQIDSYGRRTYQCITDYGEQDRVLSEEELDVGQEYFLYPVTMTNPIRVDPIIIRKR